MCQTQAFRIRGIRPNALAQGLDDHQECHAHVRDAQLIELVVILNDLVLEKRVVHVRVGYYRLPVLLRHLLGVREFGPTARPQTQVSHHIC